MATTPKGDDKTLRNLIVTDLARQIVRAGRGGRAKRRPKPLPVEAMYPTDQESSALRPRMAAYAARGRKGLQ